MFFRKSKEISRLQEQVAHLEILVSEWDQLYMKELKYRQYWAVRNLHVFPTASQEAGYIDDGPS